MGTLVFTVCQLRIVINDLLLLSLVIFYCFYSVIIGVVIFSVVYGCANILCGVRLRDRTVPHREKPRYNTRRRTAASRVFKNTSFLASIGSNLMTMRQRSNSTPHLLESRDMRIVETSPGQLVTLQRPSYDSDSPNVDTPSGGNLTIYTG